jgi:hypothetical protein
MDRTPPDRRNNISSNGERLMRNWIPGVAGLAGLVLLSGCAGTATSKYTADNNQYTVNQPVKDAECYDASVMLGADAARTRDIVKKVLAALDSTVKTESDSQIMAQRNRHIGVLVGSGGEELTVTMKSVDDSKTFLTATTKTGFVGAAGQKAWSCQIVDEAVKLAAS